MDEEKESFLLKKHTSYENVFLEKISSTNFSLF